MHKLSSVHAVAIGNELRLSLRKVSYEDVNLTTAGELNELARAGRYRLDRCGWFRTLSLELINELVQEACVPQTGRNTDDEIVTAAGRHRYANEGRHKHQHHRSTSSKHR